MWVAADDTGKAQGPLTDGLQVRPAEAILDRPSDRWTEVQRVNENVDADETVAAELLEFRDDAVACFERFRLDDNLPKERISELLIERKIEADRALPNIRAPLRNIGIVLQPLL